MAQGWGPAHDGAGRDGAEQNETGQDDAGRGVAGRGVIVHGEASRDEGNPTGRAGAELLRFDAAGVAQAARFLLGGQVVGLPTETVYGLAADALDAAAVARIYAAKGRPSDNPLIVHVTGREQAAELALDLSDQAHALMEAFWPGPLTVVVPKRAVVPAITTAGRPDVGLRAPAHPAFQAVLAATGLALAAPSANTAGRPSPTTAAHVLSDLGGAIPAVLDGGPCRVGVESTVVSVVGPVPVLLRPGGVSLAQLEAVMGEVRVDAAVTSEVSAEFAPSAPGMKYRHYSPHTPVTILGKGGAAQQARWLRRLAANRGVAHPNGAPGGRAGSSAQVVGGAQAAPGATSTAPGARGGIGVLCFDDDAPAFAPLPTITYGNHEDDVGQARRLFAALRAVDGLGVDRVYAQVSDSDAGAFPAVRNRLLKAAGFQVFDGS